MSLFVRYGFYLLLIISSIVQSTIVPNVCTSPPTTTPATWSFVNGRCFLLNPGTVYRSFTDAKLFCNSYQTPSEYSNARLADIHTEAENDMVVRLCLGPTGSIAYNSPNRLADMFNDYRNLSSQTVAITPNISPTPTPSALPVCACSAPSPTGVDPLAALNGGLACRITATGVCQASTYANPNNFNTSQSCAGGAGTSCMKPAVFFRDLTTVRYGTGGCWIGASREGVDVTTNPINWQPVLGSSITRDLHFHKFTSNTNWGGLNNAAAKAPYYNYSVLAPNNDIVLPQCVSLWPFNNNNSWAADYCYRGLRHVCVRDAVCPASYYKISAYSVIKNVTTGVYNVNPGRCALCPAGYYRSLGQAEDSCLLCNAGFFGNASDPNRINANCSGICPAGSYCPAGAGAPIPCGQGKYSTVVGATSVSVCLNCLPGYFCPNLITPVAFNVTNKCSPGKCGAPGDTNANCQGDCPAGKVCTSITNNTCGALADCGLNRWCPAGSATSNNFTTGWYGSDLANQTQMTSQAPCEAGFFCPGTIGRRQVCPVGTYSSANASTSCLPCQAGYFCPAQSSSPIAQNCAPSNATNPGNFFCPAGTTTRFTVGVGNMSIPTNVSVANRQGQQPCPANFVCDNGIVQPLLSWNNATYTCASTGQASITIPEKLNTAQTGFASIADRYPTLNASLFTIRYYMISQTFYDSTPGQTLGYCKTADKSNNGIFDVNLTTGAIIVKRFDTSNLRDPTKALDFESCPPNIDMRYQFNITASLTGQNITSNITCLFTATISDVNDQPYFYNDSYARFIEESANEDDQAERCTGGPSSSGGCPLDASGIPENAIIAFDQDNFNSNDLNYTMTGSPTHTAAHDKLKINSCTGLISQKGGVGNVLKFSDPTIPFYNGVNKRLNYTVRVQDSGGLFHTTLVSVYLKNVNDAPVFTPAALDFYILESQTALTPVVPFNLSAYVTDEDPQDTVAFTIVKNDEDAFAIVNNTRLVVASSAVLDFELGRKVYTITLRATDNGVPALSDEKVINVRVVNVNEAPVFRSDNLFYVREHSLPGTPVCREDTGVGCVANSDASRVLVDDPDQIATDVVTFSLSGGNGLFTINATSGQIFVSPTANPAALNFENTSLALGGGGVGFILTVTANSSGVGVVTEPGVPTLFRASSQQVVVYLADVNEPPAFVTSNATAFRILETHPTEALINGFVTATDPDNADGLNLQNVVYSAVPLPVPEDGFTYILVGNDPTNSSRAQFTLTKAVDFETVPGGCKCLRLTVQATDTGSSPVPTFRTYVFNIVDVNEAPMFNLAPSLLTLDVFENASISSQVDLLPTTGKFAFDLDAGDNASLSYNATGGSGVTFFDVVTLAGNPTTFKLVKRAGVQLNFELPPTTLKLLVTASDRGGSSAVGKKCAVGTNECGDGAFCLVGRCNELCRPAVNGTGFVLDISALPRVDQYFCPTLPGGFSYQGPNFTESATLEFTINILNANDEPYITDPNVPFPSPLTVCNISSTVSNTRVPLADQFAWSSLPFSDEDAPTASPTLWSPSAGVTFVNYSLGLPSFNLWSKFSLNSTTQGAVLLARAATGIATGQVWRGGITIIDGGGARSNCTLHVTVIEVNNPPDLGPDRNIFNVSELAPIGTAFVSPRWSSALVPPADSTIDGDVLTSDTLVFSTSTSPLFSLNASSGEILLIGALDFETSTNHSLFVRVADSQNADDVAVVNIYVADANEPPVWSNSLGSPVVLSIPENSPNGTVLYNNLSLIVSDPDVNTVVNAQWKNVTFSMQSCTPGSVGTCPFVLVGSRLQVRNPTPVLNFEGVSQYDIVIRAQDGGGLFADWTFRAALTDVPEPPVVASIGFPLNISEGSSGTLLYLLTSIISDVDAADPIGALRINITSGNADGVFAIDSSGWLKVADGKTLDFESVQQVVLSFSVMDTANLTAAGNFTINVLNVNDLSVSDVRVVSGPNAGGNLLSCDGSRSVVRFVGANFGLSNVVLPTTVTASYVRNADATSPTYALSGCRAINFTQIECNSTSESFGGGANLVFTIQVLIPSLNYNDTLTNIVSSVAYPFPQVTSVSGAGNLNTGGNQQVNVSGTCLGRVSDGLVFGTSALAGNYIEQCSPIDGCSYLSSCSVVSNSFVSCLSIPGKGAPLTYRARVSRQLQAVAHTGAYAYGVPTLTGVSVLVLSTYGSITPPGIVFTGTNFGNFNESLNPSHSFVEIPGVSTFTGCSVTSPNVQITCTGLTPGVGRDLPIRVTIGNLVSNASAVTYPRVRFEIAQITSIAGSPLSTLGGNLVTLTGNFFGPPCGTAGVSVVKGAVNCANVNATYTRGSINLLSQVIVYRPTLCAVVSQTQLVCTSVPGTGAGHVWNVTVGGQIANVTSGVTTSYARPIVGSYSGPGSTNARTAGNEVVVLTGGNFGPADAQFATAISAKYGFITSPLEFTASGCVITQDHVQITCQTAVGAGKSLGWTVTVDGQLSQGVLSDYGPPVITSIDTTNLIDDGSQNIIITGNNFGPPFSNQYLEALSYGPYVYNLNGVPPPCTVTSHETIACRTLPGVGLNLVWKATVRKQTSTSLTASSYRYPNISETPSILNGSTDGSYLIPIVAQHVGLCVPGASVKLKWGGTRFVDLAAVRYFPSNILANLNTDCPITPGVTAETRRILQFFVPEMRNPVQQETFSLVVSHSSGIELETTQNYVFRYNLPVIRRVYAEGGSTPLEILVTITGSNFCRSETCCQTYLDGVPTTDGVNLKSHTHNKITLIAYAAGEVFVRCPGGDSSTEVFQARSPRIFGGVTVTGGVEFLNYTFDTRGLATETIYIYALSVSAATGVFLGEDYVPATILAFQNATCSDSSVIPTNYYLEVQSSLIPDELCYRFTVRLPQYAGAGLPVILKAGAFESLPEDPRFDFLSYARPEVLGVSLGTAATNPTRGSSAVTLTINGNNFGPAFLNGEVVFGGVDGNLEILCSNATGHALTYSHLTITCTLPPGEGKNLPVRVRVKGQISAPFLPGLSYVTQTVTSWTTSTLERETQGGYFLDIIGDNFGRAYFADPFLRTGTYPPVVRLGSGINCPVVYSNFTHIRCTVPPGEGMNYAVDTRVGLNGVSVVASAAFSYDAPVVAAISPRNTTTTAINPLTNASYIFEISGKNFGIDFLTVTLYSNSTGVPRSKVLGVRSSLLEQDDFIFANHTYIRVTLKSFYGGNLSVLVDVKGQVSDESGPKFSYNPPVITSVTTGGGGVSGGGSGRRLSHEATLPTEERARRVLSALDPVVGNDTDEWSSNGFSTRCKLFPAIAGDKWRKSTYRFRESMTVQSDGSYARTYRVFSDSNCTLQAYDVDLAGLIVDHGMVPSMSCVRVYQDVASSVTTTPPGGDITFLDSTRTFGVYLVGENTKAYLSTPYFLTLADAQNVSLTNADYVDFFPDEPTLTMVNPPAPANDPVPTSGCVAYESYDDYKTKVDNFLGAGTVVRECVDPYIIEVIGDEFGDDVDQIQGTLRVYLVDPFGVQYEGSTTTTGGNHDLLCPESRGCVHEQTKIRFQAPLGAGRGLSVRVVVADLDVVFPPNIDYELPGPTELVPGTINIGNAFLSGTGGDALRMNGNGLGYISSPKTVLLNGRLCTNPTYIPGANELLGRAGLRCTSPTDVAGVRSVFTCVGNQGIMRVPGNATREALVIQEGQARGAWSVESSPLLNDSIKMTAVAAARCPPGFYGRIGELCLPCPVGANCPGGFSLPIPKAGFTVISIPSNSSRAVQGACNVARIDPAFKMQYPHLYQSEVCEQVVKCVPENSCLAAKDQLTYDTAGNNGKCAGGYNFQYDRCVAASSVPRTCQVVQNPLTLAYTGVHSDCNGGLAFGAACPFDRPWECSSCVVKFTYLPSLDEYAVRGECECMQPERCALCTLGTHYRSNNECIPCPTSPALLMALFVTAAVAIVGLGYYVQKKKINLAFIAIGVDYFQVLGILSTANIPWPRFIRDIMYFFTIFMASIDIVAPECLLPSFEFPAKFMLTQLLPAAGFAVLLTIHVTFTMYKLYKQGKQTKFLSHVSRLVGIFILIIYVLYLSLTKKALDVFNCNPLDPDDGYSYTTFSSMSCDGGGLCRCGEAGGLQESLVGPAIACILVYTVGFPAAVLGIVGINRKEIVEDQYLRAHGAGDNRVSNPNAYDVRKKYQLMYMNYKPKYFYWMLVILCRKFFIAFASLMFRGNASFQLAVILIVLFIAFTLQVRYRPYMSKGEYIVVVKELSDHAKRADTDIRYEKYKTLYTSVHENVQKNIKYVREEKARQKMGAGFWEDAAKKAEKNDERSRVEKYFFDLNAVEAILLCALIVISVSGIMFESNRFQSRPDLRWQGELIVVLVFIVLIGSLSYFFLVCINELFPNFFAKYCGRVFLRYQTAKLDQKDLDLLQEEGLISAGLNPLLTTNEPIGDKSTVYQRELEKMQQQLDRAKKQNKELLDVKKALG